MGETRMVSVYPTCNKCLLAQTIWWRAECEHCGRVYVRCGTCGGEAGVRRSLRAHQGLHHPKKAKPVAASQPPEEPSK